MLSAADNAERQWDAIAAGVAVPALVLTGELIIVLTGNTLGALTWASTLWLVASLIVFAVRYVSRKVATPGQELHFGLWLCAAPTLFFALVFRKPERWWVGIVILVIGFVYNLVRYLRFFYSKSDLLKANC